MLAVNTYFTNMVYLSITEMFVWYFHACSVVFRHDDWSYSNWRDNLFHLFSKLDTMEMVKIYSKRYNRRWDGWNKRNEKVKNIWNSWPVSQLFPSHPMSHEPGHTPVTELHTALSAQLHTWLQFGPKFGLVHSGKK